MSNRIKIELIASLLKRIGHDVELISQGEVVENSTTYFRQIEEQAPFDADARVRYASALPIRRINGLWSSLQTLRLMQASHRREPFDSVVIFNMKQPQIACATFALQRLKLPVILEYEDDAFVNVVGEESGGLVARRHRAACRKLLRSVSGCIAVSPHLIEQVPSNVPRCLLRGVVGDDIIESSETFRDSKENFVLFAGTHIQSNGVAQLLDAWKLLAPCDWRLHITGIGTETPTLRRMAESVPGVLFHGLVDREELVRLMCTARICINPHAVSSTPGNVFAFKLIEYLAAGAHVVTTPMGTLEPQLERAITYMRDNSPQVIAETLARIMGNPSDIRSASRAAQSRYGLNAVAMEIEKLFQKMRATN